MTWVSIRQLQSLALLAAVVLLADHVEARAANPGVPLQSVDQTECTTGQITGMALDGMGRLLADHRVELRVQTLSGGLRITQTAATTVTDARGRFGFTGLCPGIFEVVVRHDDGSLKTSAPIQLSAGAMDRTVTLSDPAGVAYSFEELRDHVEPGARVRVTDTGGRKTTGTVVGLSSSSLALLVDGVRRDLAESQVTRIVRRQGTWARRGALIGFGAGLGTALAVWAGSVGCDSDPECSTVMLVATLASSAGGAAAGAAIGSSIKKWPVVFLAPVVPTSAGITVSPIASKTRRGDKH